MKLTRYISLMLLMLGASSVMAFHPISSKKLSNQAGMLSDPYPEYPYVNSGGGAKGEQIKRGEYLVRIGECIACHTKPGHEPFSGGYQLSMPFGNLVTPNITPDKVTGIGDWSFNDFEGAMRYGRNPHGGTYSPAFPYVFYTKISDQDLRAMWAYLQAVPAVSSLNQSHDLHFPFNLSMSKTLWRTLYFTDKGSYRYDNTQSAQWNRGAYLVEGVGHCSMCHTPDGDTKSDQKAHYLSGAFIDGVWAPDINRAGFEGMSVDQVASALSDSQSSNNSADSETHATHESLSFVTKDDLTSMAIYLKSVDSSAHALDAEHDSSALLSKGRKVYQKACSTCHASGMLGAPMITDSDNWGVRLKKGFPALYRNVMYGFNNMPVKGNCPDCTDDDIRAGVHYLAYKAVGNEKARELTSEGANRIATLNDGKHLYEQVCAQCHNNGILNAPKLGDKQAWAPLIKKDIDVLVKTAVQGNHKKPYMSGCKSCSVQDIKAAVKYMVQESKSKGDFSLW